jgi:hypothetical protein
MRRLLVWFGASERVVESVYGGHGPRAYAIQTLGRELAGGTSVKQSLRH